MKDRLFLLKPGFMDQGEGPFFCPGCAMVEGMLSFYPSLREKIDVHYIDFPRPRQEVVSMIGAENQGMPKLILRADAVLPEGVKVDSVNGWRFVSGDAEICRYLGKVYGVGIPH